MVNKRRRILSVLFVCSCFAGFVVGGCSKENNINQDNSTTNNTVNNITQTIGPSGATVDGPDGSQLVVPPGALSEDTEVTIGELPTDSLEFELPSGDTAVSKVFAFLPHGQLFALDARISFGHSAGSASGVRLLRSSPGTNWEEVSTTDVTANRIVRDTSTFSFYVAVTDSNGGAGGSGGSGGSGGAAGAGGASGGTSGLDGGQCIPEGGPCQDANDMRCCGGAACEFQISEFLCGMAP